MSEADWLESCYVSRLIRLLPDDPEPSERKLWLFGVACCRRAAEWVQHPILPEVIDACEQAADDPAGFRRLDDMARLAQQLTAVPPKWGEEPDDLFWFANAVSKLASSGTSAVDIAEGCQDALCGHDDFTAGHGEALFQTDLFRDIFGNPFHPVAFDQSWRTSAAVGLARAMYESRDFAAMPVLADALEEAGCDRPDVLAHCRDPHGVHVRGCWVVDLVLGKS
jgi:hypothetical protein